MCLMSLLLKKKLILLWSSGTSSTTVFCCHYCGISPWSMVPDCPHVLEPRPFPPPEVIGCSCNHQSHWPIAQGHKSSVSGSCDLT